MSTKKKITDRKNIIHIRVVKVLRYTDPYFVIIDMCQLKGYLVRLLVAVLRHVVVFAAPYVWHTQVKMAAQDGTLR